VKTSNVFVIALVVFGSFSASVFSQEIKKGDTAIVPNWDWIDVMNPVPVKQICQGKREIGYGETCGIQKGGTVKVVGIDGNRLLVIYEAPGESVGTPCPSGVVFFISKNNFSKMTSEYQKACQVENYEKKLVKNLLGK
jgi:hypothetical protein